MTFSRAELLQHFQRSDEPCVHCGLDGETFWIMSVPQHLDCFRSTAEIRVIPANCLTATLTPSRRGGRPRKVAVDGE